MAEILEINLVKFDSVKRKNASQGECYHLKIAIFVSVWRIISVERYILGKKPEAQTENIANIYLLEP